MIAMKSGLQNIWFMLGTKKKCPSNAPAMGEHGSVETPQAPPIRLSKSQEENLHDRLPESFEMSPQSSADGSLNTQPLVPEGIPEPFAGIHDPEWDHIPDVQDALAPKPRLQDHHLSPEAIRSRTKRIFTPRADGSKKVSEEIWNDWKAKGSRRKLLEDIFKRCGYDPETCLKIEYCYCYFFSGFGKKGVIQTTSQKTWDLLHFEGILIYL